MCIDVLCLPGVRITLEKATNPVLLKDCFNEASVQSIAEQFHDLHPSFNTAQFLRAVFIAEWQTMELKQRMRHITNALGIHLGLPYVSALPLVVSVAQRVKGLVGMVFPDFIQVFGIEHPDDSIPALAEVTSCFSSEFAVRPFLERFTDRMEAQMVNWAEHKSEHVRRLASEGMRPRLPWAQPLRTYIAEPAPVLRVLEILKYDTSEYVRTSVANNLNDISKDHPDVIRSLAARWLSESNAQERLLRKACRTLLKQGDREVLSLFGEAPSAELSCDSISVDADSITIGQRVTIRAQVVNCSETPSQYRLEYAIHFVKANGSGSRKVFAWKRGLVDKHASLLCKSVIRFQHFSTRKLYPGLHEVEIRLNGCSVGKLHVSLHR